MEAVPAVPVRGAMQMQQYRADLHNKGFCFLLTIHMPLGAAKQG
jgi:hypothetical protein